MKFAAITFITSVAFVSQVLANPAATAPAATPTKFHCGGPDNLVCPPGYGCCGPIIVGVGGTCIKGPIDCPLL
ncbi:hypothetical protein D9613_006577 [Agrocybe pediades]|uniref:Uncharacterized protein n=1 Tax=Agrocybe pediades TaxID=84607 RepID=A0A8H4QGR5_9AGAR|nr:hypothetical protein D9613_006577 [Agrocybe pediades]